MLRAVQIFAVTFVLSIAVVLGFGIFIVTEDRSSGKPVFYGEDGVRTLLCFAADNVLRLSVEFRDGSRVALFRTPQGKDVSLTFKGGWFEDIYSDRTVEIRLDPEVYVTGIHPAPMRPCDWE